MFFLDRVFKANQGVHRVDADFFNMIAALHHKKRRQSCCGDIGTKRQVIMAFEFKETDRIKVMADGLQQCGVDVAYDDNSMQVIGKNNGSKINGGVTIAAQHDHRIGMSFLTLGMVAAQKPRFASTNSVTASQTHR